MKDCLSFDELGSNIKPTMSSAAKKLNEVDLPPPDQAEAEHTARQHFEAADHSSQRQIDKNAAVSQIGHNASELERFRAMNGPKQPKKQATDCHCSNAECDCNCHGARGLGCTCDVKKG